jgi:hypothetical protein
VASELESANWESPGRMNSPLRCRVQGCDTGFGGTADRSYGGGGIILAFE